VRKQPECFRRVVRVTRCHRHIVSNRNGICLVSVGLALGYGVTVYANTGWVDANQWLQELPRPQ